MRTHNNRRHRQGGQALIMITLALIPLFGIMGMVTDMGYMHFVKEQAQTAAEVAAKAAVINLHATLGGTINSCGTGTADPVCNGTSIVQCGTNITTPQNSIDVGCMYAAQHGFQATGNQNVTYQTGGASLAGTAATPPTASGITNISFWVTYRVVQKVPQMFSAVLGFPNGFVAARSTGVVVGANDCIYVMDSSAASAMSVTGNAKLMSGCGLYVNSSSSTALTCNGHGSSTSYAYYAPEYDIVGGNGCSYENLANATPNTGVSHVSDPLAGLAVPATGPYTCDAAHTNVKIDGGATVTLSPGTYCGGIEVKNGTLTMSQGVYVLDGGGFVADAQGAINGTAGVMIYNTFDSTHSFGSNCGSNTCGVYINSNATVNLQAMTSGTYQGILYFEDRSATATPQYQDRFWGGASASYTGTLYALNSLIDLNGNPNLANANPGTNVAAYTMIVADKFNVSGDAQVNNDYSSLANGNPLQQVAIVE